MKVTLLCLLIFIHRKCQLTIQFKVFQIYVAYRETIKPNCILPFTQVLNPQKCTTIDTIS